MDATIKAAAASARAAVAVADRRAELAASAMVFHLAIIDADLRAGRPLAALVDAFNALENEREAEAAQAAAVETCRPICEAEWSAIVADANAERAARDAHAAAEREARRTGADQAHRAAADLARIDSILAMGLRERRAYYDQLARTEGRATALAQHEADCAALQDRRRELDEIARSEKTQNCDILS